MKMTISEERWNEILQAAIDWQYLIVLAHGMARKSDCEAWLMPRFDIDHFTASQITNAITDGPRYFMCPSTGVEWQAWVAKRPAPKPEDYPDIDYSVGAL